MLGESSAERHVGFRWLEGELAQLLADVIRLEGTCLNDVLKGPTKGGGDDVAIGGGEIRGELGKENLQPLAGGDVAGGADKVEEAINEKQKIERGGRFEGLWEVTQKQLL